MERLIRGIIDFVGDTLNLESFEGCCEVFVVVGGRWYCRKQAGTTQGMHNNNNRKNE